VHRPAQLSNGAANGVRFAMRLSLGFGALMLLGKTAAWWITGSSAILSDALESVIHVVAVGFAAFSLWLSSRPASARFLYGYERISFFSAGWEGGLIAVAGAGIIVTAIEQWRSGLPLQQLGLGTVLVASAAGLNGALGYYLIRVGRRNHSLIVEANGRHVLSDCWTSAGVIVGLVLVMATGWKPFDPICAMLVASNILWSGASLMIRSVRGLMDYADPETAAVLRSRLDELAREDGVGYHGLRFRETGGRLMVEVHLLFPYDVPLGEAHRVATRIEDALEAGYGRPMEVVTHLEALEDHGAVHRTEHKP
jgi:cation diffusion facilitator family transporter